MIPTRKVFRSAQRKLRVESLESRCVLAALLLGEVSTGQISVTNEVDDYTFAADGQSTVDLAIRRRTGSAEFEPVAQLRSPSGVLLDVFGNTSSLLQPSDGLVRVTLPDESGTYTLSVSDYASDATGNYDISFEGIAPISPAPLSLGLGNLTGGTISHVLEGDQYKFTLPGESTLDLVIRKVNGSPNFDPYAELFTPDGERLEVFGNSVQYLQTSDGVVRVTLPSISGDYMLQVHDSGLDATGSYQIGFEGISPISPAPVTLPLGGIKGGSIGSVLEADQFTFTASASATVDLVLRKTGGSTNFVPLAELFTSNGQRLDVFGNSVQFLQPSDGVVRVTLPAFADTYMLQVRDGGLDGTGTYQLGFEGIQPISPSTPKLLKGGITTGGISNVIEGDEFAFTASANSTINLVIRMETGVGDFHPIAELFTPSGARMEVFGNGYQYLQPSDGVVRVTLPDESGTYMLLVRDDALNATGTYAIGFEGISPVSPTPRTLVRNATSTGQIGSILEQDQFVFRGMANETIQLTLSDTAIDADFQIVGQVFTPAGALLRTFSPAQGEQSIQLTGGNGNYLLHLYAADIVKRGDYSVSFTGNPLPAVIAAPTNLQATTIGERSVALRWTDTSSNELGFQVAVSFDNGESFVTVGTTSVNATSFTVGGLVPGQNYKLKVRAFNTQNTSLYSNVIDVITRPVAPSNLRATNITANSLRLLWNDNSDNETGFRIFRRLGTTGSYALIGNVAAGVTSFNVGGLTAATKYQFIVRSIRPGVQSNPSNTLTVTTA